MVNARKSCHCEGPESLRDDEAISNPLILLNARLPRFARNDRKRSLLEGLRHSKGVYIATLNGIGMNVIIKIIAVIQPIALLFLSNGVSQYKTGGCRSPSINSSTPHIIQPSHRKKPSTISTGTRIFDMCICFSPMMAYAICPPSSCPMGIRFNAVTKKPIQPANAMGCKRTSYESGISPRIRRESREKSRESPRARLPFIPFVSMTCDNGRPIIVAIRDIIKPAMGPDAPISISAILVVIGDFIFMNAPIVPISVGAGMK